MAFLREAVDKQKQAVIQQLIVEGVISIDDRDIYQKTISELADEYADVAAVSQITRKASEKNTMRKGVSAHD
ncbi:Fur-regulated basic protein FbpA [Sediminibacillus dalangtanensis]|uniref:Fur-regulated basic protein FbpA n=1 Tax=Sediminibacillus dalangtanensis TaxID=2729421 RepID=A0ABX7W1M3_9BACI|nr:Fur-regulated basic protein FbpA [Sediminibacillus dalangtanensis]QTN01068.1 Fur-regulated basic protein FbpA [Sediminibacillus dalangtanensis]